MNRIGKIAQHLEASSVRNEKGIHKVDTASEETPEVKDGTDVLFDTDADRHPATHWNGWGYADTAFVFDLNQQFLTICGGRFAETLGPEGNRLTLNDFIRFAEDELGVDRDLLYRTLPAPPTEVTLPKPDHPVPKAFLNNIQGISFTDNAVARMRKSHGHTCQEVFALRVTPHLVGRPECKWLPRLVDGVVFPESTEQVKKLIAAAQKHNVCLAPRGGGTSVTRALSLDGKSLDKRPTISVDMRRMKKILWVDKDNHVACVQAGLSGAELEKRLNRLGLTTGHEPDSIDFSTVGGWIATKASGMKRARYGNIEDIVISVNLETCMGTMGQLAGGGKPNGLPAGPFERVSAGPDISKALALGSEGTMGIVTDCILKLKPLPTHKKFGSVLFKDFDTGINAMRELARKGLLPASARLMDNAQFKLGQALRPVARFAKKNTVKESLKSFYIETWNGFDTDTVAAATFMYEGFSADQVASQERAVLAECKSFGGAWGDSESGKRGYFLTFMIAYLRDFGLALNFLSESFEATVPWSRVNELTKAVQAKIRQLAKEHGVKETPLCGVRISQAYDTCCCCYFYFGFVADDMEKRLDLFSKMEHESRQVIIDFGGSVSHHHGVGKAKKEWFSQLQTPASLQLLSKTIKNAVDPKNIFGLGNLGF